MSNIIQEGLKRDLILSETFEAYRNKIIAVTAFSTSFNNQTLEGTDKVIVPYIPNQTTAVKDFDHTAGYLADGNTNTELREITIDRHKYVDLSYSDTEKSRQPYLDTATLSRKRGEDLGEFIITDILSIVTASNFANEVTIPATAFEIDDLADLRTQANVLGWDTNDRSLIYSHDYDGNLIKDPRLANYDYGTNTALVDGMVPKIHGFGMLPTEYIPSNGENLVGLAVCKNAIGVGFSPIAPAFDDLIDYQQMTDPDGSGLILEYYCYYDRQRRVTVKTINASYGFNKLEENGIIRIKSV